MLRTSLLSLVPLLHASCALAQRTCYFSDGTTATGYSACNNVTEHSGCCRLYQLPSSLPVDLCTTNGLCLGRNGVWNGFFFQSACTDPTWQSSNCPQACPALDSPSSSIVQPCNATSGGLWCCRADGTGDCCANSKAVAIGQLIIPASLYLTASSSSLFSYSTASSTTVSSTVLSTVSSSSTIVPTLQTTSSCTNTTTLEPKPQVTTATIGVGASLGVAFLATLAMLAWREATWRKRPSTVTFFKEEVKGSSNVKLNDDVVRQLNVPVYHELGRDGHGYQELGPGNSPGFRRPELEGFNHF